MAVKSKTLLKQNVLSEIYSLSGRHKTGYYGNDLKNKMAKDLFIFDLKNNLPVNHK